MVKGLTFGNQCIAVVGLRELGKQEVCDGGVGILKIQKLSPSK